MHITCSVCISLNDFSCGFNVGDTEKLLKPLLNRCAKYQNSVNLCCAIHKDCYGLQKGKSYCDSELCSCIKIITVSRCKVPVNESCTYVRSHKGDYNVSTLDTEVIFTARTRENLGLGSLNLLRNVYEECDEVPYTLRACDVNLNSCLSRYKKSLCKSKFIKCTITAAQSQNSTECDNAVRNLHRELENPETSEWSLAQKIMICLTFLELLSCITIVGLTALIPIRFSLPPSDEEEGEVPLKESPMKKSMETPKTPSAEGLKGSAESPNLKQPGSRERTKDSAESPDLTRPHGSHERSKRSAESPDKPGSHERSKRSESHEPAEPPKRESAEKVDRHSGENLHQPFPPPVSPAFHTGDLYLPHPFPGASHPFEQGSLEPFKREDYGQREIYEPRSPDVNFFDLPKLEKEKAKKETGAKKKTVAAIKGQKSPAKVEKKTGKKSDIGKKFAEKLRIRKIGKALALFGKGKKK